MAIAYECDMCGKIVSSESRQPPGDYFSIAFQGITAHGGYAKAHLYMDVCHDCNTKVLGFIETVKTGGSKYEWKAVK